MEVNFETEACSCLRQPVREIRRQEQCQEVRLPDELPDIGHVVAAWGQMILRGKQWQGNAMQASAGVMAWILYEPEDGSACRRVEAWIPIQVKWEFPQTEREGIMCIQPQLCRIDARTISPRKLSVRAEAVMMGQAWEPVSPQISKMASLPQSVEVLTHTYPVTLVREAGEKAFSVEEELSIPASQPDPGTIVRYELVPHILEQKVLGSKLVFRGTAALHLLYEAESGQLCTWDTELPFSQLAELEQTFSQEARGEVIPAVTNLELEQESDGVLNLKCGIVGQYRVSDVLMLEIPEDAYSPVQEAVPHSRTVELPRILDSFSKTVQLDVSGTVDGGTLVDVAVMADLPAPGRSGDQVEAAASCNLLLLIQTEQGKLQGIRTDCQSTIQFACDETASPEARLIRLEAPQIHCGNGAYEGKLDAALQVEVHTCAGAQMLESVTVGEEVKRSADRPALVLRRFEDESLWELAKHCGSTVGAIRRVNHLEEEPLSGQMLLIPVV